MQIFIINMNDKLDIDIFFCFTYVWNAIILLTYTIYLGGRMWVESKWTTRDNWKQLRQLVVSIVPNIKQLNLRFYPLFISEIMSTAAPPLKPKMLMGKILKNIYIWDNICTVNYFPPKIQQITTGLTPTVNPVKTVSLARVNNFLCG